MDFKYTLLNQSVKHWIYGEGKIIEVLGDTVKIQFDSIQKEYGERAFESGFVQLVEDIKRKEKEINEYLSYCETVGIPKTEAERLLSLKIPLQEVRHRIITIDYYASHYPYLNLRRDRHIFFSIEALNDYVKKRVRK